MTHEQPHQLDTNPEKDRGAVPTAEAEDSRGDIHIAWDAFQLWTGGRDTQLFRRSYLGRFDSRDAFGLRLLQDFGANERLQQLPDWLRAIVRLDGAAFATDFERAGAFHIYDAPQVNGGGSYIFDAYCLPGDEHGCICATTSAE